MDSVDKLDTSKLGSGDSNVDHTDAMQDVPSHSDDATFENANTQSNMDNHHDNTDGRNGTDVHSAANESGNESVKSEEKINGSSNTTIHDDNTMSDDMDTVSKTEPASTELSSVQHINDKIQQKIEEIQKEIEAVMNGTHEQYIQEINKLQKEKELRESSAKEFLEMKMQSIQNEYESELSQLATNFEQQVSSIKQTMIDSLISQQRKIEETGQIGNDEDFMSQVFALNNTNARKLRRRAKDDVKAIGSVNYNPTRRNFAVGLKINYKLSNQEISQDLGMIRDGKA